MYDFHCHSYHSDGHNSPVELLELAQKNGIKMMALTDHDTVAGLDEMHRLAKNYGITFINGIEISTRWKKHDIHIVGLNFKRSPELDELINGQKERRQLRAQEMGKLLEGMGIDKAWEKACEIAGHNNLGRPHFAKVLVREHRAKDMEDAFKKYLKRGKPAYVPTPWIGIPEAVKLMLDTNGTAVLAHPLKYGLTRSKLLELMQEFKAAGGQAIEIISGDMTDKQVKEMIGYSRKFGFLTSTGSDFHGSSLSRVTLGKQREFPPDCQPVWNTWNI